MTGLIIFAVATVILWWALQNQASFSGGHSHSHDHGDMDDLTKIEGIGPKVQKLLNDNGILTYTDLGKATIKSLNALLDENDYQMMEPRSWPKQAKLAAKGDWDALKTLQEELDGGR